MIFIAEKADFVLVIGDFNTKLCNCPTKGTTRGSPARLYYILYGMKQLISEPPHILRQSSSCIDFIFANHLNIVMASGVDSSLHMDGSRDFKKERGLGRGCSLSATEMV